MSHYYDKKMYKSDAIQKKMSSLGEKNECLKRIEALKRVIVNEPVLKMTAELAISEEKRRINELENKIVDYNCFLNSDVDPIHKSGL